MPIILSIIAVMVAVLALVVSNMRYRHAKSDSLFARQKTIVEYCADTIATAEALIAKQEELQRAEERVASAMGMASSPRLKDRLERSTMKFDRARNLMQSAGRMNEAASGLSVSLALEKTFIARKMLREVEVIDRSVSARFEVLRDQSVELRREALARNHAKTSSYS